jgi:hypothetical protein
MNKNDLEVKTKPLFPRMLRAIWYYCYAHVSSYNVNVNTGEAEKQLERWMGW